MFYVLNNAHIFDKATHLVTFEDVGELEDLYYATCGTLNQCLRDVSMRLNNHFIAPGDKYITYNSDVFGIDGATAGDFKATLQSYAAFLYSTAVVDLLKEAVKAKHIRGHRSGSRPVFLDVRNMACAAIFATLTEKHLNALSSEELELRLETLPTDMAALYRQQRLSTGIQMREKFEAELTGPKPHASRYSGSLGSSQDSDDEDEDKIKPYTPHYPEYFDGCTQGSDDEGERKIKGYAPRYLEYLDEYSVSAASADELLENQDAFDEYMNHPPLADNRSDIYLGFHGQDNGSRNLSTQSISLYSIATEDSQIDKAMMLDEIDAEDHSLTRNIIPCGPGEAPEDPVHSCMCKADCICVVLCAAEPRRNCPCLENSLFWRVAQRVKMDELPDSRQEVKEAEAMRAGRGHAAMMADINAHHQHPFSEDAAVERTHTSPHYADETPHDSATNDPFLANVGNTMGVRNLLMNKMFGGSLSMWAVELPNGERVMDWSCDWYEKMEAETDARHQLYEPDPDWYFPPGAKYGRLDSRRVCEQLTLRKRILDKTIGNITGKKAMFPALKLKEEFRTPTQATVPAHQKRSLMSSLFGGRLSRRAI